MSNLRTVISLLGEMANEEKKDKDGTAGQYRTGGTRDINRESLGPKIDKLAEAICKLVQQHFDIGKRIEDKIDKLLAILSNANVVREEEKGKKEETVAPVVDNIDKLVGMTKQ